MAAEYKKNLLVEAKIFEALIFNDSLMTNNVGHLQCIRKYSEQLGDIVIIQIYG